MNALQSYLNVHNIFIMSLFVSNDKKKKVRKKGWKTYDHMKNFQKKTVTSVGFYNYTI